MSAELKPQGAPAFVLVPRVASEAMLQAAHRQIDWCRDDQRTNTLDDPSQTLGGVGTTCREDLADAWAAFLEAAQATPPTDEVAELEAFATPGAAEAFDALDVADRIIERACGEDVIAEWHEAYQAVAKARTALRTPARPGPTDVELEVDIAWLVSQRSTSLDGWLVPCPHNDRIERIIGALRAPAVPREVEWFTDQNVVDYIARYGGMCRDCADEAGVCPSNGLPCENPDQPIRHVLKALSYGLKHGYIAPVAALRASPTPVGGDATITARLEALERDSHPPLDLGPAIEGYLARAAASAGLPDDVIRLVVAARIVAFENQGDEALKELDDASEAFASRVPWDDEPEAAQP